MHVHSAPFLDTIYITQGYYRRAEAYRLLVSSQTVSTELTSSMLRQAVQDYVQCYKLTQDLDTLCQAAMLAVHKGKCYRARGVIVTPIFKQYFLRQRGNRNV